MPAAPAAIPPNPKMPAMMAKMKNVSAQESIVLPRVKVKCYPVHSIRGDCYAIAVPRKPNRWVGVFFSGFWSLGNHAAFERKPEPAFVAPAAGMPPAARAFAKRSGYLSFPTNGLEFGTQLRDISLGRSTIDAGESVSCR